MNKESVAIMEKALTEAGWSKTVVPVELYNDKWDVIRWKSPKTGHESLLDMAYLEYMEWDIKKTIISLQEIHPFSLYNDAAGYEAQAHMLLKSGWKEEEGSVGKRAIVFWVSPRSGRKMSIALAFQEEIQCSSEDVLKEVLKSGRIPLLCNQCETDLRVFDERSDGTKDFVGMYGLITEVSGGYWSKGETGLKDCHIYHFAICEICLKKIFDGFKIPPHTEFGLT